MKSNYSVFFKVEMLHEYFLNHQCKDFEIIPSADSGALFEKARILCRNTENKFIAFIEDNNDGEPFFNTPSSKSFRNDFGRSVFRFYLKIKNPLFFNYTNLKVDFSHRKKFYFSNLAQNKNSDELFLSAPVSLFSANKEYIPGDLVKDSKSGQVFEALKKNTAKKETELTDPQAWSPRGQRQWQYANENDAIEYSSGKSNFVFSEPVKKSEITIFGFNYNPASPAYDAPVKETETKNLSQPTSEVSVDLSSLPPGKYMVKVNDQARIIYFDPLMSSGNVFGILEIFNFLPAKADYALLTEDEKIKKINYQILFAARSVLWKYVRKDSKAQMITDSGSTAYQFQLQGNSFVSSSPIPLSEQVLRTLTLEFNTTDFKLSPLPNPTPERFSTCKQNDFEYLCSEMYLNY